MERVVRLIGRDIGFATPVAFTGEQVPGALGLGQLAAAAELPEAALLTRSAVDACIIGLYCFPSRLAWQSRSAICHLGQGPTAAPSSALLGHSGIAVTARYLAHLTNRQAVTALAAVDLPEIGP